MKNRQEHNCKQKAGLTLLEVLLAVVILGTGVSALMLGMARCLAVVRTARCRDVARNLLRRVDVEDPIDPKDVEEGETSGTFSDHPGYTWHRTIEAVDENERAGLFLVTTRVSWSERGRNAYEEIQAYKYAPQAASVTRSIHSTR